MFFFRMVLENKLKQSDQLCSEDTPLNLHNSHSNGSVCNGSATILALQNSDGENWPIDQCDRGSWTLNTSVSSESNQMGSTEYIKMDNNSEVTTQFCIDKTYGAHQTQNLFFYFIANS